MSDIDHDTVLNTLFKFDEDIAIVLGSLANKRRLQLLTLLTKGTHTFKELQKATGLGKTALAHHLAVLVKTGLLKHTGRGRYELSQDGVELLNAVGTTYASSKRRRELEAARRADYIQKTHTKRREP
ncbi:MAG: ArsR family transcriptional regulator, partial [Candidatus Bathyarchaeota archaeon]